MINTLCTRRHVKTRCKAVNDTKHADITYLFLHHGFRAFLLFISLYGTD